MRVFERADFRRDNRASSERMIPPPGTRSCGEMRGQTRLGGNGRPMKEGFALLRREGSWAGLAGYASPDLEAPARRSILLEKNGQLFQHLTDHARWSLGRQARLSRPPVEALHLIGENHARNGAIFGERHLEGIALDSRSDGAQKRQAAFLVIASRADDQRGAAARLLMPRLWSEGQPDDITSARNVVRTGNLPSRYHASAPCAGPASCSAWRLSAFISASISASR